ncbi:MAG: phosphatidylinositol mannoside acyltransferase [Acidimicrobiales bacterium]|nr:phosphatidylinositol mannoside acyltransferase [Acidimicrobiales bacterium]
MAKIPPSMVRNGYVYGAKLIRKLPNNILSKGVYNLGKLAPDFLPSKHDIVAKHMRRVLGESAGEKEVEKYVKEAFASYAKYWIEGAQVLTWPADKLERALVCEGFSNITEAVDSGQGVVVALAHLGNWEVGGAWLARKGYPMWTVAEVLETEGLFEFFVEQRELLGLKILPLAKDTGTILAKHLKEAGVVGLLCDRDIQGGGIEVEFFGEKTTLPPGPAMLAYRCKARLVTAGIYTGQAGGETGYLAVVNDPIEINFGAKLRDEVNRLTQVIAKELEGLISRAPSEWHLFQPNWPSDSIS